MSSASGLGDRRIVIKEKNFIDQVLRFQADEEVK